MCIRDSFDAGLARAYHLFVDDSGELDGTLHHHTVGDDGREDIVLYFFLII